MVVFTYPITWVLIVGFIIYLMIPSKPKKRQIEYSLYSDGIDQGYKTYLGDCNHVLIMQKNTRFYVAATKQLWGQVYSQIVLAHFPTHKECVEFVERNVDNITFLLDSKVKLDMNFISLTSREFKITIPNTGEVIQTSIHNNFDTLLSEAVYKLKQ